MSDPTTTTTGARATAARATNKPGNKPEGSAAGEAAGEAATGAQGQPAGKPEGSAAGATADAATGAQGQPAGKPAGSAAGATADAATGAQGQPAGKPAGSAAGATKTPRSADPLGTNDPKALDPNHERGAVLNPPLLFGVLAIENEGQIERFPCRAIVLHRHKRPAAMNTAIREGEKPRDRWFYFVITTADGARAKNRDKEIVSVPKGTVLWIDEGPDLRCLSRLLPNMNQGKIVSAQEVLIDPLRKDPWTDRQGNEREVWRYDVTAKRTFTSPAALSAIATAMIAIPDVPTDPAAVAEAGGAGDDDIPF